MFKKSFIALLFMCLTLFTVTASARTDWPIGEGINAAILIGQDIAGASLFVALSQSDTNIPADKFNLLEFPERPDGSGIAETSASWAQSPIAFGGAACLTGAKPGPRL